MLTTMFNRRNLGAILRVVFSITLLLLLFSQIDIQHFIEQVRSMNVSLYLIGLVVFFIFIGLWSLRWYTVIRAAGEITHIRRVFTITLVGNFFALFLPEAVGSDLARMYGLREESGTSANIVSTVLLDRVIGLISLVLTAVVGVLIGNQFITDQSIVLLVIGVVIFFVVGWILFFNRRFMEWCFGLMFKLPLINRLESSIRALYESLYGLHNQPRLLLTTLLVSLVVHAVEVISVIFIARALGIQTELFYFFIFLPIIWLLTTIPISISGLGVREGAFVFFFAQVGVSSVDAIALSLIHHSLRVISGVVGGLIFMRLSIRDYVNKRQIAKQEV